MKFDRWLAKHANLADASATIYARTARRWCRDGVTDPSDVAEWVASRIDSRTPLGTALGLVAAAKWWAAFQGADPVTLPAMLPRTKLRQGSNRDALTDEELGAFEAAAVDVGTPETVQRILWVMARTGLRIAEACQLPRDCMEQQGRYTVLVIHGKGDKMRAIPLVGAALPAVTAWVEEGTGPWLFPSPGAPRTLGGEAGTAPWTEGGVRRHVRKIREAAGFRWVTPHVLRHTAATTLARHLKLHAVQKILGHANIETTAKYLHPSMADMAEGLERL